MNACENCVHTCKSKEGWCAAYTTPAEARQIRERLDRYRREVHAKLDREYMTKTAAATGSKRTA